MTHDKPTGVVLLNMGGPEKLDDVRPFLYNLFSDREIIRLGPKLLQKPIAWMIASRRAPKSRSIYETIGGRSPLADITTSQGLALQEALQKHGDFRVTFAMRYWHPSAVHALSLLKEQAVTEVIALTLYPHFSRATTGSSLTALRQANDHFHSFFTIREISAWPDQPLYVDCLTENIRKGLQQFEGKPVEIVYSAHSLPVSFIQEGDPYVEHLKKTITAIEKKIRATGRLCYQSRSGPVEWLSPSTPETLNTLAQRGCKNILMVPISFVSDHVETLYEINMLYREQAKKMGMRLEPSESLNINPRFINCLKNLVLNVTTHGVAS